MCYLFIYNYLSSLQLNEGNKTPSVFLFGVNFKENKQTKKPYFLMYWGMWECGRRVLGRRTPIILEC